jgi:SET domain-containing protein
LGAFATSNIRPQDFIGEYVGEIIGDRSDLPYKHVGLNYVFGLNKEQAIDSLHAGNETRFINHSKFSNCSSTVVNVNGEQRICIVAGVNIQRGTELLLNYGKKYWGGHEPDE